MSEMWPVIVKCYGRKYSVVNREELDQLIEWLTDRRLALANRYRIGASWPRGERAKNQPAAPAHHGVGVIRPPEPDGALDLSECPFPYGRCRCGRCVRCGAAKHTSMHGPMLDQPPGSSPWGHRYDEGPVN